MHIIDWHSHIWLPEHLGDKFGPQIDGHYAQKPSEHGTPEAHRAAMDADGVTHSVVIALTSDHLGMKVPNEFIADYVRDDPRLVGIASVDPNHPDCRDEFIHAITDLGLSGLKLAPPYQAFHPHSDRAMSLYDAAQDLDVVVYFHQGAVSISQGVLDYAQPLLLDKVAREFPRLRIVIAHVGQPWFMETVALLRKHPNVYADVSARCERPWQIKGILAAAMDYGVQERLLFGSDFPTFQPAEHARSLLAVNQLAPGGMEIPEEVLRGIVSERPLAMLGLDAGHSQGGAPSD